MMRFLVIVLIFAWIFSGWPQMVSFAEEAISTPTESTTSMPSDAPFSPVIEQPASEEPPEVPPTEETQISELSQPALSSQPPLKEHKLEKQIILDENAQPGCQATNFTIDISNKNSAIVELDLNGKRDSFEDLEIGSLPLGIDIIFLNNADYSWSPSKSDNTAVLQITNQDGSQKGSFSIPIIYTKGNSTTICQINIVNQ